ncbi:alpha-xylosidase [Paenibacillus sp. PK3_47]|uniref:glycoside hydrolase family 31 protein n=1 Tax=Paenibacillus sp. PK3_47 TaxID=2072642 RepID=UPI00201D9126|nr:TIM-barrel domain-containing protein [Paenibacillus sp. PK3_47]UQZ32645.1 alpha-xylosidase [Paenibacillus sp. PK3_47]
MNKAIQELPPLPEHLKLHAEPKASRDAVIEGEYYRFTILTPQLIRMEYSAAGSFEDRATQTVLNRSFTVPEFRLVDHGNKLEIMTERLHLSYDKQPFSRHGLSIRVRNAAGHLMSVWNYGDRPQDLGGTARTLDNADGAIPLEPGLLSRQGYTLVDDSRSLLLEQEGLVQPRAAEGTDLYFFGYGHDYLDCLKDFYQLSGRTPLLPRYTFGNWWSRYYPYSADEYKLLMERFEREELPFSVAVIDMDWHLVDVDPKYGSGWTGYTWNRRLFPDPQEFLAWLHDKGLRVTLNVHPADGVRAFEEPYLAIAAELGMDPEAGDAVEFDITDPKFLQAYFKFLHHPLEEEGVDFWWIDWQQGGVTKVPGLDPLWMLNHYHYLDSGRRGSRRLTFSRYAGLGSHRYPVGFSGDTIVTWESLDFQPYFTANASNAGYGWWSHDIGGHMQGYLDDELVMRWVQFGVFSPLLRLHSSASPFFSKEPWRFNHIAGQVMKDYLRLRHRLIPYLYTMNRYASRDGLPLVRPMYYHHAEQQEAYQVPNQYYFGTELLACPLTQPVDKKTGAAEFKAWLPEGKWVDFFSGRVYDGGRRLPLFRGLESIPVLAKAGAIVPMADLAEFTSSTANPQQLEIRVFAGDSGHFQLWEDAGNTLEDEDNGWCRTEMSLSWGEAAGFTIGAASGNTAVLPEQRSWKLSFTGFAETGVTVLAGGKELAAETGYDEVSRTLTVIIPELPVTSSVEVRFLTARIAVNRTVEDIFGLLNRAQIRFGLKEQVYRVVREAGTPAAALASVASMELEYPLYGALCEILTAN